MGATDMDTTQDVADGEQAVDGAAFAEDGQDMGEEEGDLPDGAEEGDLPDDPSAMDLGE